VNILCNICCNEVTIVRRVSERVLRLINVKRLYIQTRKVQSYEKIKEQKNGDDAATMYDLYPSTCLIWVALSAV